MIAAAKIVEGCGILILSKQFLYLRTADSKASFLPATLTYFNCSFWSLLIRNMLSSSHFEVSGIRGFTSLLFLSSLSATSIPQPEGSAPIHTITAQIPSLLDPSMLSEKGTLLPPYCSSTLSPVMNPAPCFYHSCLKRDDRYSKKTRYSTSRGTNEAQFLSGLPLVVGFSNVWSSVNSDLKLPHTQSFPSSWILLCLIKAEHVLPACLISVCSWACGATSNCFISFNLLDHFYQPQLKIVEGGQQVHTSLGVKISDTCKHHNDK